MTFSDCLFRKGCREISPACGAESTTYDCYEKDEAALNPDTASKLHMVAEEFEGIAMQIKEFLDEQHTSPPMVWDVQEFYERYKTLVG